MLCKGHIDDKYSYIYIYLYLHSHIIYYQRSYSTTQFTRTLLWLYQFKAVLAFRISQCPTAGGFWFQHRAALDISIWNLKPWSSCSNFFRGHVTHRNIIEKPMEWRPFQRRWKKWNEAKGSHRKGSIFSTRKPLKIVWYRFVNSLVVYNPRNSPLKGVPTWGLV